MKNKFTVLTINRSDTRGGAASVAWNLFSYFHTIGLSSWYVVQYKSSNHDQIITVQNERHFNFWRKSIGSCQRFLQRNLGVKRGIWRVMRVLDWVADPAGMLRQQLGIEEFNFKGFRRVFLEVKPDVVHAHVLHGGFFDLRYLEKLSKEVPVFVTLHDAWLLAGHCAHSFDCERWRIGCGNCPDLTIPPAINRDGSAFNWKRKERIYRNSRLYIAAPCEWLMSKVKQSMLAVACVETRVIPNGINHKIFYPSNRREARMRLGLPHDDFVFLFSANGIRRNRWKDFEMMKKALELVAARDQARRITFLALGDNLKPIVMGNSEIRFIPYRSDPNNVADFYRASDVYLHASKADTFPNAILEALSCGIPVIGTAVGGIPEQIKGWQGVGFVSSYNSFSEEHATGVLVEAGDAVSFAKAMSLLMESDSVRNQLGQNAAVDAFERFPIQKQTKAYLDWYRETLAQK